MGNIEWKMKTGDEEGRKKKLEGIGSIRLMEYSCRMGWKIA
jgi:hypothetical protein